MADRLTPLSPLEPAAKTVGTDTREGLEILANDTGMAILLALWKAKDPRRPLLARPEPTVSFSNLRDRVDVTYSGQFNYHLEKLV